MLGIIISTLLLFINNYLWYRLGFNECKNITIDFFEKMIKDIESEKNNG